ncbi:DUF4365 domain-containing protein [Streptomyces sp. NPDC001698]|uniref:DUF4365 domain-containing protein n=1 Tax=Streptomyces sp. NPDC001698 TaxID=3364601 RepID=UPI0036CEF37C
MNAQSRRRAGWFTGVMSPKRPRSHLNADLSVTKIQEAFLFMGWNVEILNQDYGEDLLVRIFEGEAATPYTFYVQAKSTDRIRKQRGGPVRYPITFDHLQHWREFWDPVFLMLWERESGEIIWEMIQQPSLPIDTSGKKAKVLIPRSNRVDPDGLKRIQALTIARHQRLKREQSGTEALIEALADYTGAKIDYRSESGIFTITEEDGRIAFVLFGPLEQLATAMSESRGISVEELVEIALMEHAEATETLRSGKTYTMHCKDGRTLKFSSEEEFNAFFEGDIYE